MCASSTSNWIVVCLTGVVIWIPPLQPVASSSKTVLPLPEPTIPAMLLFLGDSLSLPEIKTLLVNESKTESVPHKKVKTEAMDKGCTDKITDAKNMIILCKSCVLAVQLFCKELEACTSQMMQFIREQLGELEWVKRVLDKM